MSANCGVSLYFSPSLDILLIPPACTGSGNAYQAVPEMYLGMKELCQSHAASFLFLWLYWLPLLFHCGTCWLPHVPDKGSVLGFLFVHSLKIFVVLR